MTVRVATRRRTERTAPSTVETILRTAESLLQRYGEDGLSIRELCARTGVTPPTIYHHFGDKQTLVDRIVDACFAEFDSSFDGDGPPGDAVAALSWMFERYVAYGAAHPAHYRLIFQRAHERPTPAGLAAYDRLRRAVARVAEAGRLRVPAEDATAACWAAAHGVTALVVAGFFPPDTPAAVLMREAILSRLIHPPAPRPTRRGRTRRRT